MCAGSHVWSATASPPNGPILYKKAFEVRMGRSRGEDD